MLQRSTYGKKAGIYCGHLCTQSSTSACYLGELFLFLAFVRPVCALKADLYGLDYPHSSALWLLVECAGERAGKGCVPALHLSLGSDNTIHSQDSLSFLRKFKTSGMISLGSIYTYQMYHVLTTFSPISKNVQENPFTYFHDPYFLLPLGWHFIIYSFHTCIFIVLFSQVFILSL